MSDNKNIFRESSLKRVSSPDDLDQYIKTTTPSIWILLFSVVIFLTGVVVWSTVGKIEVKSLAGLVIKNGEAQIYIKEDDYNKLNSESYFYLDGQKYLITNVSGPYGSDENSNQFLLHIGQIGAGDWYYILNCACSLRDGEYQGKVVFEEISPISFVVN